MDEGRSLRSGSVKAPGELGLVCDAGPGTRWDSASLPSSAGRVLGIISSIEDAMCFSLRHSNPPPGVGRMFFQLGYLLARIGKYPRCSWRSWGWMLTFAPWDIFWGGSGLFGCGGYRMWSGEIRITLRMKLTRTVELFFFPFVLLGLKAFSKGALCIREVPLILHVF